MKPWFCHSHCRAPVPIRFGPRLGAEGMAALPAPVPALAAGSTVTHSPPHTGAGESITSHSAKDKTSCPKAGRSAWPQPCRNCSEHLLAPQESKRGCETAMNQHQWLIIPGHQQTDAPPTWSSLPQRCCWARGGPPLLFRPWLWNCSSRKNLIHPRPPRALPPSTVFYATAERRPGPIIPGPPPTVSPRLPAGAMPAPRPLQHEAAPATTTSSHRIPSGLPTTDRRRTRP